MCDAAPQSVLSWFQRTPRPMPHLENEKWLSVSSDFLGFLEIGKGGAKEENARMKRTLSTVLAEDVGS